MDPSHLVLRMEDAATSGTPYAALEVRCISVAR
jgi:hypothetical protein